MTPQLGIETLKNSLQMVVREIEEVLEHRESETLTQMAFGEDQTKLEQLYREQERLKTQIRGELASTRDCPVRAMGQLERAEAEYRRESRPVDPIVSQFGRPVNPV